MHHARVCFGNLPPEILIDLGPGLIRQQFAVLTIDDSRTLKESQSRTLGAESRFWLIEAGSVTLEAQQALLKTFEEPTPGHYFILVVPRGTNLLPTLLSRVEIIWGAAPENVWAKKFLSAKPEIRLDLVEELLAAEASAGEGRVAALAGLQALGEAWRALARHQGGYRRGLAELVQAGRFLAARAGLPKLVLEHLALVLPRV